MNRRRQRNQLRDRLRIGRLIRNEPTAPGRRRRISRREREARRQRQLRLSMIVAGVAVVLILGIGAANEYFIKPRHVLATVDGTEIRRRDYWKVRSYDLINQFTQYSQFAQLVEADQQQQYLTLAQQAAAELEDVWGSTGTDDTTLSRMVEDQIYLKRMDELGVTVSDEDVDNYILQQFEPTDAPIFTPTPSPTLIPTRAAWATQTAQAGQTPTADPVTPESGTPEAVTQEASPEATPDTVAATPDATPIGSSPVASPQATPLAASPDASPVASPVTSPTPDPEQAVQTAEAGFESYSDAVFEETHMSRSDYERLIVRPAVARQKVTEVLGAQVGQTAQQVHAAHILVGTKDLADSIYSQLQQPGANFEEIAMAQSTDTSTAPNGGDLGWFTQGTMVDEFESVAFELAPGAISEPFQTQFGWHIVKVYAHEQDRPMTDDQISRLKQSLIDDWVEQQRTAMDIDSELDPTPTAAAETFSPPPDAPPVPTPTSTAGATPEASPVATPAGSPVASPAATPAAPPVVGTPSG